MLKKYTCIICPNGCEIQAEIQDKEILSLEGAACPKGKDYVTQELTAPMRNIATSVLVENGELPLASVRLLTPIPKEMIFEAMKQIKKVTIKAPVKAGSVVLPNILGTGSDVIVTKDVLYKTENN